MIILFSILYLLLFAYLAFNVGYLLLFAIAGRFRKNKAYPSSDQKRIAVLIPAYKEDQIILETAQKAAIHDYPKTLFDVFIIADQLKRETLKALAALPITIIPVSFETSTKAKSLKYALQQLPDNYYDMLMLLDADNIMEKGCLQNANDAFVNGFKMIQLHRTAKNKNTPTAILDAISEEINNHIFRQGHRALGVSSALIGSGMAFDYPVFKELMMQADIENNPGEDREIYLEMLKRGYCCEYIEDALVYDEKVQSGEVLEKQRTRWISAQLQYAVRFWIKEPLKTLTANKHYFDYALQTLLLPRSLLLMILVCLMIIITPIFYFSKIEILPGIVAWAGLFLGCILSLLISIYPYLKSKEVINALKNFPSAFWSFLKAFLKSKANQQEFIHTPKGYIKD